LIAGKIDGKEFRDLVERYLASIRAAPEIKPIAFEEITPLPVQFPDRAVQRELALKMKEPIDQVQVTFPVQVGSPTKGNLIVSG
jgi:hypothetical protein